MLTTIAKRIQSRLSRSGIKAALGDIKAQCELMIADIENPTELELIAVQEYFMSNASQLTVINEETTDVDNANTVSIQHIDTGIDENEVDNEPHQDYPEQSPKTGGLVNTTKNELVASTAQNMGITLDTSEISLIAENINDSTDTLEQDIDTIKAAIIAFVEHKAMVSQQKINNLITEVRKVVTEKNQENSQLLSDGLTNISNDIQEANKQFKSNVKTALSAFTIPAIKAG
ncbi:MAG: hypothetical protein ACKPA7_00750 [Sphaerospermopsis kisseleviana]